MLSSLFDTYDALIVLDTETTGFRPREDEIIELGFVVLTADGTEREEDVLIRLSPGRRLPRGSPSSPASPRGCSPPGAWKRRPPAGFSPRP